MSERVVRVTQEATVIAYREFLRFGLERDPAERLRQGVRGFLRSTRFSAIAVTSSDRGAGSHAIEHAHGYEPSTVDYIRDRFVTADPLYRASVPTAAVNTWTGTGFEHSYAAERWLIPGGFHNGASVSIVDPELGELGSIHTNCRSPELGDREVEALTALAGFLSIELAQRRRREALGLTAREREVVRLIAEGASNPQIAARLHVSRSTVSTHVEHILRKFGTRSRVSVAVRAAALGLLVEDRSPGR